MLYFHKSTLQKANFVITCNHESFFGFRTFATALPSRRRSFQGFPKGVYLSLTGPLQKGDLRRGYTTLPWEPKSQPLLQT